jgi:hypothetical protein
MSKEDVKQEEQKEETKEEETSVEEKASSTDPDEELYESVVGSKENKIPYSRFKEVNDAKKAAEAKIAEFESEVEARVEQEVRNRLIEQELVNKTRTDDEFNFLSETEDTTKKEIEDLKGTIKQLSNQLEGVARYTEENILKQQLKQLKESFPAMNEEHVLAAKKLSPKADLEELAKYSNDMFLSHAKGIYQKMLDEKKVQANKAKVTGAERIKAMKPKEAPKSLEEAKDLMLKFVQENE